MKSKAILLGTLAILLIPLIAMQFTSEVVWTFTDFLVAAILLLGFGFTYKFLARKMRASRRKIVLIILAVLLLWLWAELAVGVFTNWGS